MKIFLIVSAIIAVAVLIVLLIPVKLEIEYIKDEEKNQTFINLKYGLIKMKLLPKEEKQEKKKKNKKKEEKEKKSSSDKKKKLENIIAIFNETKKDITDILIYTKDKAVFFDNVEITSEFGFEDAMYTGIFGGAYNGFVYMLLGMIDRYSNLGDMKVELKPEFGKSCFNIRILCILRLKTVHIIVIALRVLKIYRVLKKEGRL